MAFIGLVGIGYWGKNLARDLYNLGQLRAICDINDIILDSYPDIEYSTTDFGKLLEDPKITAIVIATPSKTHFELAKQVLGARKDCFIEKPMTQSVSEAKQLIQLANDNECVLMVGHLLQYHAAVQKIYTMIEDDQLGELLYVTCNRLKLGKIRQGENVLWSFAPHDISLILRLMGELPKSVVAHGYSTLTDYDITTTILRFSGNRYAQIYVNWLNPFKEHKLTVVGTKGMITFDGKTVIYYADCLEGEIHSPYDGETIGYDDSKTPLQLECEMFIHCCQTREVPLTNGHEGLRVMTVLESALNSLKNEAHSSAVIDDGAKVGDGTKIWHFSHLMSTAIIGNNCVIGQNCFIAGKIGNNCKVQNNVSIYEGVVAGNSVFFGPSCVFTNDLTPRAAFPKNGRYMKTIIEDNVTVGANATILCGVTLRENCMIGAGAVVTKDVAPNTVMVGNPARVIGMVDKYGKSINI